MKVRSCGRLHENGLIQLDTGVLHRMYVVYYEMLRIASTQDKEVRIMLKKYALIVLFMLAILASCTISASPVRVRGYTRKDGTYVAPHYRSSPDSSKANNWSTKGNTNPYTGKEGTKDPYTTPSSIRNKDVWVNGYLRSDGTYVSGYFRSAPGSGSIGDSSALGIGPKQNAPVIDFSKVVKQQAHVGSPSESLASKSMNAKYVSIYPLYLGAIKHSVADISEERAEIMTRNILSYSDKFGVDPRIVVAMVITEAYFRSSQKNESAGKAQNYYPDTQYNLFYCIQALSNDVKKYAAKVGVKGVASIEHVSLAITDHSLRLDAVRGVGSTPPYKDRHKYVLEVMDNYRQICADDY